MASSKPQLNVRLTAEWMEELPILAADAARALGLPEVSIPDTVMMGLALLRDWVRLREESRAGEVAGLPAPEPEGVSPQVGRPPKTVRAQPATDPSQEQEGGAAGGARKRRKKP